MARRAKQAEPQKARARSKTPARAKSKAPQKGSARSARAKPKATPKRRPAAAPATFYVCRSCVWSEAQRERDGKRQGTFLLEAVQELIDAEPPSEALKLRAVFCLNGCKSPCNVGFRAPGKHHVRFSKLTPANAEDVIAYARAYQASPNGDVADDDIPKAMRGKMTVRTPPIG